MTIGSHSQSFRMLVDAGSADMWVPGDGCQGENGGGCGPHPHLGPRSSSTFKDTRRAWYTSYGSGSASGTIVRDRVRFAGFSLEHTFGVARNESRSFIEKDIPLDGVLGCAKSNISMQGVPTLVESLQSAGMIEKNIISYKISRRSDGKNDGEITLGGMDPTKYDPSTLVRLRNVNRLGFWAASLDALKINGKHIKLGKEKECILDTGSTLISVPDEDAAIIHRSIPGSAFNSSLSSWTVPCRTKTIMTFYFGGRPFPVKPSDLAFLPVDNPKGACTSAIVGNGGGEGTWLLGDTVIKNIYLSTDQDRDELAMARLT
ncbi:aspartic peptidase domain-containing protein [Roridomyces roridus]|uniref:Aspartic peptidase domain-containing protein n=1 Tax=Roridomyces roridus TaxID=1738132 RepID=A0AAD7G1G8_9AGAR|nr:aspartic peptidase domain-containing protein [Roridomyces roridus]